MSVEIKPKKNPSVAPILERKDRRDCLERRRRKREEEGCSSKLDSRVFLQNFKERKEEGPVSISSSLELAVSCHGSFGPLI
ncbi:hypothetical protein FNV43_RR05899 [Rhamnella rubrinervis]|uniref:Uncharacterized protein n=1 Tax=Rhamnella rubrinervis TaxID=2594499 RepID=A0A8K0HDF5_9ROSA|nr:hypothetical protein FNV43_RR05899 [Rhamnella rubrinervis]